MDIQKVTDSYLYNGIVGFYDHEHIMILGSCVKNIGSTVNIKGVNGDRSYTLYMSISDCCYKICKDPDCIINICSCDHVHTELVYKRMVESVILVKYTHNDDIFVDLKRNIDKSWDYIDLVKYDIW